MTAPPDPSTPPRSPDPDSRLAAAALIGAPIAGFLSYAAAITAAFEPINSNVLAILLLLLAAAIPFAMIFPALRRAWRMARARKRVRSAMWALAALLSLASTAAIVWPMHVRDRCGAFTLQSSTFMRAVGGAIYTSHETKQPLPPSLALLVVDGVGATPPWQIRPRCPEPARAVRIGAHTLDDWLKHRVTRDDLQRSAAAQPEQSPWRPIGHYMFCVDQAAWATHNPRCILGYERKPASRGVLILYATGDVRLETRSDIPTLAANHPTHIIPLPPDFLTLAHTPNP